MSSSLPLKILVLPLILLLSNCTTMGIDSMLQTTSITTNAPFLDRATAIYDAAKECWNAEIHTLYSGTDVEKNFTEESAAIIARWNPATGKGTGPIIKIIITPHDEGSVARIYEREHPYITKGDYEGDAERWLNGLYSCI